MLVVDIGTSIEAVLDVCPPLLREILCCESFQLTEAFLDRYARHIDWSLMGLRFPTRLSDTFMERHWEDGKRYFLRTQDMSDAFIRRRSKSDGRLMFVEYRKASRALVHEWVSDSDYHIRHRIVQSYPRLSIDTLNRLVEKGPISILNDILEYQKNLPVAFIERHVIRTPLDFDYTPFTLFLSQNTFSDALLEALMTKCGVPVEHIFAYVPKSSLSQAFTDKYSQDLVIESDEEDSWSLENAVCRNVPDPKLQFMMNYRKHPITRHDQIELAKSYCSTSMRFKVNLKAMSLSLVTIGNDLLSRDIYMSQDVGCAIRIVHCERDRPVRYFGADRIYVVTYNVTETIQPWAMFHGNVLLIVDFVYE